MKEKLLVLLMGCSPFLIGRLQDFVMMNTFIPLTFISCLMLLLWGGFGVLALRFMNERKTSLLLLNTPAAVVLLLILVQEWVVGAYWFNFVGTYTQMFYLPFISLGFRLVFWADTVVPAYIAAFILLILTSVFVYMKKKA